MVCRTELYRLLRRTDAEITYTYLTHTAAS